MVRLADNIVCVPDICDWMMVIVLVGYFCASKKLFCNLSSNHVSLMSKTLMLFIANVNDHCMILPDWIQSDHDMTEMMPVCDHHALLHFRQTIDHVCGMYCDVAPIDHDHVLIVCVCVVAMMVSVGFCVDL